MTREKSYDIYELRAQIYWDLPPDIGPFRRLLENYSGIRPEDVDAHILAIREKLWQIKPYGCIGKFRFLQLDFTSDPGYQQALILLKKRWHQNTFLDMGCCIGQVLRQLAFDGVSSNRLFGADLEPRFMEVGYELFQDKKKLRSVFLAGDVLESSEAGTSAADPLRMIDGKITIVHASSFFHLFDWDDQVRAAKRIVRMLKPKDPNVFIFGRQVGCKEPGKQTGPRNYTRYLHNAESWQQLWDEVGKQTGTRWRTEVELIPGSSESVTRIIDGEFNPDDVIRIRFGVYRARA